MKVLHITDSLPSGGAFYAFRHVLRALGHRSWMMAPPPSYLSKAIRTIGGYCDPLQRRHFRRLLRDIHKPDLVHLHNFKSLGTAVIAACKDVGIPVVWSCLDYWCLCPRDTGYGCCNLSRRCGPRTWQPAKGRRYPLIAKLPLLGRRCRIMGWMNLLDAVIALSEDSKQRLREGGLTAPPIHVVPLPIKMYSLTKHVDPNLVLFVGGPAPHKGKHVFDAAMKIVQAQRPEIVGKSMFGVDRHQVLREIARAACLVVPEQWPNPGPVVIAEAQLLGTPVVASAIGGIPEMHPARLCPHTYVEFFAASIFDIVSMSFPEHAGQAGQKDADRRHDHATIRKKMDEVYQGCV